MAHTIVIGGQPDYFTQWRNESGFALSWTAHGREITDGVDAEKTLDGAPSVRYRAESIGSGEYRFFGRRWTIGGGSPFIPVPSRGICGIVHNLLDVGARARHIAASSDVFGGLVYPDSTVASSNTADTYEAVDQDPYNETPLSTFASPTTTGSTWYLEVGFANATALYTTTTDSQTILVYLKWNGTYASENTATVLIEVKEGATVRASKNLRIRPTNGNTFITAVLVNPASFTDTTLDGMSVRVTCTAAATGKYWQVGSIAWIRMASSGVLFDSGWKTVEAAGNDLEVMSADAQASSIIPYLDGNGELSEQAGNFTYTFLYWDDSYDVVTAGRPRIFSAANASGVTNSGSLTGWRPEVGIIAEGPAYGTDKLQFNWQPSWVDRSVVRESKGGNDWVRRKEPRRRLAVTLDHVSAADYAGELFSVMRRTGVSRPFCVAIKPASGYSSAVKEATSIYGKLVSFNSRNNASTAAAPEDGDWWVEMVFEEVL